MGAGNSWQSMARFCHALISRQRIDHYNKLDNNKIAYTKRLGPALSNTLVVGSIPATFTFSAPSNRGFFIVYMQFMPFSFKKLDFRTWAMKNARRAIHKLSQDGHVWSSIGLFFRQAGDLACLR
jgi:hypothetical protein